MPEALGIKELSPQMFNKIDKIEKELKKQCDKSHLAKLGVGKSQYLHNKYDTIISHQYNIGL